MNRIDEMAPREHTLRQLARIVRQRWRIVAGAVVLTIGLVAWHTFRTTPIYEASVAIRIDEKQTALTTPDVLRPFLPGNEIGTEMEELATRTLAEEVVGALGLQLRVLEPRRPFRSALLGDILIAPTAPARRYRLEQVAGNRFTIRDDSTDARLGEAGIGQRVALGGVAFTLAAAASEHEEIVLEVRALEDAADALRRDLRVERAGREANVVAVAFRGSDPELVRAVPNTLATRFIERRRHVLQTEARSTVVFLREQLGGLSGQLARAEDALRSYRERERVYHPEVEATSQLGRILQLQTERTALEAERAALGALLVEVQRDAALQQPGEASPYRRLIGFPAILRNQAAAELLRSIVMVENERSELLTRRSLEDPDVRVMTRRVVELEQELRTVAEAYLQGLTNHVASLDAPLGEFGDQLATLPAREVEFARRQREARVLEEIYVLLQTRLKEAEIAQAVEDPTVRIIDPAIRPRRPIRPDPVTNLLSALVMGIALGIGGALLREFGDRSVRTREDLADLTGLPVLGMIPRIPRAGDLSPPLEALRRIRVQLRGQAATFSLGPRVPAANAPGSRAAAIVIGDSEMMGVVDAAYSRFQTNIAFARPGTEVRVVLMTSAQPGDGKTTSSTNFALTLARNGHRVLLIDADLHRGASHAFFQASRTPGLSEVLLGTSTWQQARVVVNVGGGRTVDLMPTGMLPPNPRALFGLPRLRELLAELRSAYDLVVIDSPPLNAVSDAAILSPLVDGVVLVARAGVTPAQALELAAEQLAHVQAPVLGTLLNDVAFDESSYYQKAYAHYHTDRGRGFFSAEQA